MTTLIQVVYDHNGWSPVIKRILSQDGVFPVVDHSTGVANNSLSSIPEKHTNLVSQSVLQQWTLDSLISKYSSSDQLVQLYVSASGNFPGGHNLPQSSDNHRLIVVPLREALQRIQQQQVNMQSQKTLHPFIHSPGELYYIYQIHDRIFNDGSLKLLNKVESLIDPSLTGRIAVRHFWISSGGSFTPIHYDNSENLLVQLSGKKHVLLWNPSHIDKLYLNPESHENMDRQTQIDFAKYCTLDQMVRNFPRFLQSIATSVTLCPGEVLYIPKGWPHAVFSETNSVSTNYWWAKRDEDPVPKKKTRRISTTVNHECEVCKSSDISHKYYNGQCPYINDFKTLSDGTYNMWVSRHHQEVSYWDDEYDDRQICCVCGSPNHFHIGHPYAECPNVDQYELVCGQTRDYWVKIKVDRGRTRYRATISKTKVFVPQGIFWPASVIWKSNSTEPSYMFLIGGSYKQQQQEGESMILCYHTETAKRKPISFSAQNYPKGTPFVDQQRWGHSASIIGDIIYLIGGFDRQYQYNQVVKYDIRKNIIQPVAIQQGRSPHPRAGHSATVLSQTQILIFGGQFCNGGPYDYFNDVHIFDTLSNQWTQLRSTGQSCPPPRSQHSAVLVSSNRVMISGGSNATTWFNELYFVDICMESLTANWTLVQDRSETCPVSSIHNLKSIPFRIHSTRSWLFKVHSSIMYNLVLSIGLCDSDDNGSIYLYNLNDKVWEDPWNSNDVCALPGVITACQHQDTIFLLNKQSELIQIRKN